MKPGIALPLLAAALWAHPCVAQAASDTRIATMELAAGGPLRLPTADDTAQAILFANGESIRSVTFNDPAAYIFGVSGTGDSLTLKPVGIATPGIMWVQTERNSYEFELVPANFADTPLVVHVSHAPSSPVPTPAPVPKAVGSYALSGDRLLRPAAISDDGRKTYIQWAESQSMPAVFGIGPSGDEEMVEGYMRSGIFTIDRIYDELVFRIDKKKAQAKRVVDGGHK